MSPAPTTATDFSPEDDLRLAGDQAGDVTVWLEGEERVFRAVATIGEDRAVRAVTASLEHGLVAAGHQGGAVSVWDLETGETVDQFRSAKPLRQLRLAGRQHYLGVDAGLRAHRWRGGPADRVQETLRTRKGRVVEADALALFPDRILVLSGFDYVWYDRAELLPGERISPVKPHQLLHVDGWIGLSASGRWYFLHWDDYLVLDPETGERRIELPIVGHALAAALSDAGPRLAIGTVQGHLVVVDPDGERVLDRQVTRGTIRHVAISGSGDRVSYLDDQGGSGLFTLQPP